MCYKHILVAVDLSDESHILIRKATSLAKLYGADVSIVHVDINYSDLYTGLIDLTIRDIENKITTETHNLLASFAEQADYPIKRTLSGNGDLGQVLLDAITKYNVDLVVCGHHQDFWSKLMSSARQVINTLTIDTLVVPLSNKKEDESAS